MNRLSDFLLNVFWPTRCHVCRRGIGNDRRVHLCEYHAKEYGEERHIACPICHKTYDRCTCLPQFASPYIQSYTRVARYREMSAVGKMLLRAKSSSAGRLYSFLAEEMEKVLKNRGISADLVTYIPCSYDSLEKKGFDHGALLAKALGKRLGLPVVATLVCNKGQAQKTMKAEWRLENSKKRLAPRKGSAKRIAGKRVLLLDDIMTSGASSLVASIYLNELGAQSVDFVCFGGK